MATSATPTNIATDGGRFEVVPYTGSTDDAQEFGVRRLRDVDAPGSPAPMVHLMGTQEIRIGDLFKRRVKNWDADANSGAGDWLTRQAWQYLGDGTALKALGGTPYNPTRVVTRDPGQLMVTPEGVPIFVDEDGNGIRDSRPVQPDIGEQARDPYTGRLVFDENGDPVLVTG